MPLVNLNSSVSLQMCCDYVHSPRHISRPVRPQESPSFDARSTVQVSVRRSSAQTSLAVPQSVLPSIQPKVG